MKEKHDGDCSIYSAHVCTCGYFHQCLVTEEGRARLANAEQYGLHVFILVSLENDRDRTDELIHDFEMSRTVSKEMVENLLKDLGVPNEETPDA